MGSYVDGQKRGAKSSKTIKTLQKEKQGAPAQLLIQRRQP
jgi:hypothetical protein